MSSLWRKNGDKRFIMISRTEINYLENSMRNEGLSSKEIKERINNLILNQHGFKQLRGENSKIEKRLEKAGKKIDDLREKLKKKEKQIFDLKHELTIKKVSTPKIEKETRGKCVRTANVHQLKRILCLLESENEPLTRDKISKTTSIINSHLDSALNFLTNHNLIKKENGKYLK